MAEISYRRHRFPPVVIQHAVWLYLRFTLSYRDVEDLLAERGLDISYETVRRWVLKFGPLIARRLRWHRPRPNDPWHLDEMISGSFGSLPGRFNSLLGRFDSLPGRFNSLPGRLGNFPLGVVDNQ